MAGLHESVVGLVRSGVAPDHPKIKAVSKVFEKIAARQIPAQIIFEDDEVMAFQDVNPQAPVHILIVPKQVIPRLAEANESNQQLLGKLLLTAAQVARDFGISQSGYRVVINSGPDAGESVPHIHLHLLGKRALAWPPG